MSIEQTKARWDQALRSFLPRFGLSSSGAEQIIQQQCLTSSDDRKAMRILLSRLSGLEAMHKDVPAYYFNKSKLRDGRIR